MSDLKFYRYDASNSSPASEDINGEFVSPVFSLMKLSEEVFNLVKETPKGYWICKGDPEGYHSKPVWVSKTARKRYAYPDKKSAILNMIKRKEFRAKILKAQLNVCTHAIEAGNRLLKELENEN